ncbi:MAG: hypothetical protein KF845_14425 [Cyclobacteriaceae bacterium]|nr:hypothetical protein [Cyclobacteriaceae bacterium]
MTEVKLYKTPFKGLKIFALTIPFIAIGIWMILKEPIGTDKYIIGWIGVCFFGLGIPVGLFQTFDRRPQIIINENGIWDRTTNEGEIKWEQIHGAYTINIHGQKFTSLVVDDSFVFKTKQYKWTSKINKLVEAQRLNLHLSQLDIDDLTMLSFIEEMAKATMEYRKGIIQKYFRESVNIR